MCCKIEYYNGRIETHDLSGLYLSKLINKLARGEDLARLEQVALESSRLIEEISRVPFWIVTSHALL